MALAPRPAQLDEYSERLKPATSEQFGNEITACLVLVAPVGMTEEAREEWLKVAWVTLKHLPADLLAIGCQKARETADHPSKIVPAILFATKALIDSRRDAFRNRPQPVPRLPEPAVCTPEQAAQILQEEGLSLAATNMVTRALGPLRMPTRSDYLDMGVDPSTLDGQEAA
jgi:hypothetical protein